MRLIDADTLKKQFESLYIDENGEIDYVLFVSFSDQLTFDFVFDMIDGIESENQWISAYERLPEMHQPVLWWCVHKDIGHIRIGQFEGTVNHGVPDVSCCGPACKPLYWMPLPEPPKEE